MDADNFIELLAEALQEYLPGESAHMEMDPLRPEQRKAFSLGKSPRESAVLVLWHWSEGHWQFPLIQRPEYNGMHSGQIALPGGKLEINESPRQAALRETKEEIGVNDYDITLIGDLSEIYIPPSNFNIQPVVGFLADTPIYTPDMHEVVDVFDVKMEDLLDDSKRRFAPVRVSSNVKIQAPCFDFDGRIVWGATAMILSELADVIKGLE